jgi:hypothetical protein
MRRTIALLALLASVAFCTACGDAPPVSMDEKQDQITVRYPNVFLQGDKGKVTFELEGVERAVINRTTQNGNTVDKDVTRIRAGVDPNHDIYVEVQLLTTGLTRTDPLQLKQLYKGDRVVWEWELEPAPGMGKGSPASLNFQVHVTLEAKTPGASTEDKGIVWRNSHPYRVEIGLPALFVKGAAFVGSPAIGMTGITAVVKGRRRRRKDLEDGELEEDEEGEAEDEVSSTVYAPEQAGQGDGFLVQVFVHLPEQAASLDEIAKEADEDARRRISSKLQKKIKRGTELTFHLVMPGLDIDDEVQSCVWNGEPSCVQFGVTVPEDCKAKNIFGTVTVSESSIPIGHLKFKFKITGDASSEAEASSRVPVPAGNMIRYQQAFISYASKDRQEVLKRVQMLNLTKIQFFQDLLTLEPGDSWEKLLYDYIDKSDVFFLFWSTAASESQWVRKEVEYAIKRKTGQEEIGPEIIPVIIEGPPPAKPPADLSFLHFNDKLIYFINTREIEAKPLDG